MLPSQWLQTTRAFLLLFICFKLHVQWEWAIALFNVISTVGLRLLEQQLSRSRLVIMAKDGSCIAIKAFATPNYNSKSQTSHMLYSVTRVPVNSSCNILRNGGRAGDRIMGTFNHQYPKASNSRSPLIN